MTYQGRTNYETWAVKLWIDNEENMYSEVTSEATSRVEDAREDGEQANRYDFAQWLRSYVDAVTESDFPSNAGIVQDLFNAAYQSVNWDELAESYLEDAENELD